MSVVKWMLVTYPFLIREELPRHEDQPDLGDHGHELQDEIVHANHPEEVKE